MTSQPDQFAQAIEAIYEAASAPQLWPEALHQIAHCFNAEGATLQDQRDDGTFLLIGSPGMEAVIGDYQAQWWDKDIRVARAMDRGLLLSKGVVTDEDLATPEEMASNPIYTEYLPRHGLGWAMAVAIAPHPRVIAAIGVQRAKAKGPFTHSETNALARIGRHVEKSMRLSIRIQDAEMANVTLGDALTKLGAAVFLLDTAGQVVFANDAAKSAIGGSLALQGRYLVAQDPASRGALDAAIAATARGDAAAANEDVQTVLLRGVGGQRPKVAYVLPASKGIGSGFSTPLTNVAAVVLVLSSERGAPPDASLLRDLLGVTLGEARLAALVGTGMAPKQAADTLGISEQTARVVLKRIFQKAGVSRQGELVTLIARLTLEV